MTKQIKAFALSFIYLVASLSFCVFASADKTELQTLYDCNIDKTEYGYTEESYNAFNEARNAAEVVLKNSAASQSEVDEALADFIGAVKALVPFSEFRAVLEKDTYVHSSKSGDNFGSEDTVFAKYPGDNGEGVSRKIYLGFDISELPEYSDSVMLKVYATQTATTKDHLPTVYLYSSDDTEWLESGMTWSNKPAINQEEIDSVLPGNVFQGSDDPSKNGGEPKWLEFDATSYVNEQKELGNSQITFVFGTDKVGSSMLAISTKENENGNQAQLWAEVGDGSNLEELVKADLDLIDISDYINDLSTERITTSLSELPKETDNGYVISWTSDNTDIMSDSGEIISRPDEKTEITLTVTAFDSGISFTKDFKLTVVPVQSGEADKTQLRELYETNADKIAAIYGEESFKAFSQAMKEAKILLDSDEALQDDIDEITAKLTEAVNNLNLYQKGMTTVIKDSWVQNGGGTGGTNYGSDTLLNGKLPFDNTSSTARQILLGFDISGIGSDVSNVTLRTYMMKNGSNGTYADTTIYVHGCSNTSWNENTVTWNTRPQPATMSSILDSVKPGDVVIYDVPTNHRWIEFDVTDYIRKQVQDGKTEATLVVLTENIGSAWIGIASKEHENGNGAQLVYESGSSKTIGEMMEEDLADIDIADYINDSSVDRITQSLKDLPTEGANGYQITWESQNPELISDSGEVVKRPDENTEITMTAIIKSDGVTHTRDFTLTMLLDTSSWSDLDFINKDLADIKFSDFSDQDPEKVYSDITLPEYLHPDNGVTFSWSVSDSALGQVNDYVASFNPQKETEAELELIVTAHRNSASNTKAFPIKLIRTYSDNIIVTKAAKVSASSGSAFATSSPDFETWWESKLADETPYITFDFGEAMNVNSALFCEKGNNIAGFKIQTSDDKKTWNDVYTGTTLGEKERNLIELGEASGRYIRFFVTAKKNSAESVSLYSAELFSGPVTDRQAVTMDANLIKIPGVATSDITLPTTGKYGSTIKWTSSNSSVISDSGKVTPASQTVYVTLTAVIKKGNEQETISGDVKVPVAANISYGGGGGGGGGGLAYRPSTPDPVISSSENNDALFVDVPETHWARGYITDLCDGGVIAKAQNFRPEDSITREEFLKMLVIAAGLPEDGQGADFSDVDKNEWYYKYISSAVENEIVSGMGDGSFGIGMPIIRQDMAVMAERILNKYGKLSESSSDFSYSDESRISEYAKDAVGKLASMKIMNGNTNGAFMPLENATRAEASKIISLLYEIFNSK